MDGAQGHRRPRHRGHTQICDEDGNELPAGEAGTVYFADGRKFEYHNDPKKTAESRQRQGFGPRSVTWATSIVTASST